MCSVHSGQTRGLVPKDWPRYDPDGFRAMETSMVDFARNVFTQAECEARRTAVQEVDLPPVPTEQVGAGQQTTEASGSSWRSRIRTQTSPAELAEPPVMTTTTTAPATTATGAAGSIGEGGGACTTAESARGEGGGDDGGDNDGGDGSGGRKGGGNDRDSAGSAGEDEEEEGPAAVEARIQLRIDRCWVRKDRAKWTEEMKRAHKAFERGKAWGLEWAVCVDSFFDFEGACGNTDTGSQIPATGRPKPIGWWIGRGRPWDKTVDVGMLGDSKTPESFVFNFWKWWMALQPDKTDWSLLVKLHGKNGLLHVMAALLWWGERVAVKENPLERIEWSSAVQDVSDVLTELLKPGVIPKRPRATKATKAKEKEDTTRKTTTERRGKRGREVDVGDEEGAGRKKQRRGAPKRR
ncbi:hypothetical protein C8R47DRAFT_1274511 [Mycena vitilis]|nr:hypothetical protein C8R47DRAFT_1274511 [Mycena vitilis]